MLHIGLLVGLQLILLLFRLIVGGHFIWLLIWTLLVRPCRLIGVNPVLVDQICLVRILGKCKSKGEEEGKKTKHGRALKRCLCWCEEKWTGWKGLEVVARVEEVTSRGPAHLPSAHHTTTGRLLHFSIPPGFCRAICTMYILDLESTFVQ